MHRWAPDPFLLTHDLKRINFPAYNKGLEAIFHPDPSSGYVGEFRMDFEQATYWLLSTNIL